MQNKALCVLKTGVLQGASLPTRLHQHGSGCTGLRAQEQRALPIPSHCAQTTRPSLTVPTPLLPPWQGLPVQQAAIHAEPKKGEVCKATKQASKSYGSQLASAEAGFKAVTWKQAAPYHPHGLPSPLTLHLLKGDSRTMSVPLCLRSIILKTHPVLYVCKSILYKGATLLLVKMLWWLLFIVLWRVTLLLSTIVSVSFCQFCCHSAAWKFLPSLCWRIILRGMLCSHHIVT